MSRATKVEIIAPDPDEIFRPFFEPRERAQAMRRGQSKAERKKYAVLFERYGCLSCHRTDRVHASLGLCEKCHSLWGMRLHQIVRKLKRGEE